MGPRERDSDVDFELTSVTGSFKNYGWDHCSQIISQEVEDEFFVGYAVVLDDIFGCCWTVTGFALAICSTTCTKLLLLFPSTGRNSIAICRVCVQLFGTTAVG